MSKKIKVAMDLSTKGKGGGPYTSTTRIMNSNLKNNFEYVVINYDVELGRGISFKRILDLKKQIKLHNPDIVHFTGLQLSGFHMIVACKLAGVKNTIVTIRGFSGESIEFNPIKRFLMTYFFEFITMCLTKRIYGVSEYVMKNKLVRFFNYKTRGAIYNFSPIKPKQISSISLRKCLNISDDSIIVVSVARINKEKGYHILNEAIKNFAKNSKVKFIIVGEGAYKEEMIKNLESQINKNQVHFLGYREDISEILSECDIFVLPTLHETLSVALLEASSEKLALVGSNVGGVPEIIETNYNGILVEPGNSNEITNAINLLCDDSSLIKRMGENAFKKLNEKFSAKTIEKKIANIYEELYNS